MCILFFHRNLRPVWLENPYISTVVLSPIHFWDILVLDHIRGNQAGIIDVHWNPCLYLPACENDLDPEKNQQAGIGSKAGMQHSFPRAMGQTGMAGFVLSPAVGYLVLLPDRGKIEETDMERAGRGIA